MADVELLKEKLQKEVTSRAKTETTLGQLQKDIVDAVDKAERRCRVEALVTSCREVLTK